MIVFHVSQVFLNFIAMACFASVASFQAKWNVGPCMSRPDFVPSMPFANCADRTTCSWVVGVRCLCISGQHFPLVVHVTCPGGVREIRQTGAPCAGAERSPRWFYSEREWNRLEFLDRVGLTAVQPVRVLNSSHSSFITTISAWTQPGCKDPEKDPHAGDRDDGFKDGLPNWCNTKRAGAIFFWLGFIFWTASFVMTVLDWRSGKSLRPRDPPFARPAEVEDDYDDAADGDSAYNRPVDHRDSTIDQARPEVNRYSSTAPSIPPISFPDNPTPTLAPVPQPGGYTSPTSRPSMDVYGAFSDPVPSGYSNPYSPPEPNRVSRTMQYADPYAAVRASITPSQQPGPPSYESNDRY